MVRVDEKEVLRYMGVRGKADDDTVNLMRRGVEIARRKAEPRYATVVLPVERRGGKIIVGGADFTCSSMEKLLVGYDSALLLTATVGHELDGEVRRLAVTDMALSLAVDAAGTAMVEEVANEAQRACAAKQTHRFSPGYGDMPLLLNKEILKLTNAMKLTGVTSMPGGLLNPSKSVTAIAGVESKKL